jgi:hypothetical protein
MEQVLAEIGSRAFVRRQPSWHGQRRHWHGRAADCPGGPSPRPPRSAASHGVLTPPVPVCVPNLTAGDIFDDVFRPLMRDGAGVLEVGISLQAVWACWSSAAMAGAGPLSARA